MADRGYSAAMLAELAKEGVRPAYLVQFQFDAATLFLTDAAQNITWGGDTYERTNGLLSFSGLRETGEPLVNTVTAVLSGVDTSIAMAKVLNDDFLDRPMLIYQAFRDSSHAVIASPELVFDGKMDGPTISEDPDAGTCTVSVKASGRWADFGRKPGRHTNNEEQQFFFTGDLGFDQVSEIPKVIVWGRA